MNDMNQKGAGLIIPILVIAVLAIGGYMFFGKKDSGTMVKKETPAKQGIAVGEPNPSKPVPPSGNPDEVAAAISASLDEETAAADASSDADLVDSDNDTINSYADSYDATNF